jgi:hypothetical protein
MRGRRCWLILCVALLGAAAGFAAHARDAGRFEVRNAYVELDGDSWLLDVRLDLALADAAQQAFDEGVPLVLELEVEANLERRLLPDDTVVSLTRKWQIAHDAIAERFVVTDLASGARVSHASQAEALEALARITGLEIADTGTLPADGRFDMRVRATVKIGDLPAAVQVLLFWKNWSRSTEWYDWKVRP